MKGTGNRYLVLFTLSELQEMFKVKDSSSEKFIVYAYNGDDSALGQIDNGVCYSVNSSIFIIYFSSNIASGKRVRINYLVIYNNN